MGSGYVAGRSDVQKSPELGNSGYVQKSPELGNSGYACRGWTLRRPGISVVAKVQGCKKSPELGNSGYDVEIPGVGEWKGITLPPAAKVEDYAHGWQSSTTDEETKKPPRNA